MTNKSRKIFRQNDKGNRLYDFAGEIAGESRKAIKIFDGIKPQWIPRSVLKNNFDGTFSVPEWFAIERKMIGRR